MNNSVEFLIITDKNKIEKLKNENEYIVITKDFEKDNLETIVVDKYCAIESSLEEFMSIGNHYVDTNLSLEAQLDYVCKNYNYSPKEFLKSFGSCYTLKDVAQIPNFYVKTVRDILVIYYCDY